MTLAIFEFPLNEKVRTYLRLEQLLGQLDQASGQLKDWQPINFFQSLFSLLDLFERVDVRNDLVKDLDTYEKNLILWSKHPDIDQEALGSLLKEVVSVRDGMSKTSRLGSQLKEDRFLSSIRPRFSIAGGTCCFDLPNMHYWLELPTEIRNQDIVTWLTQINLLKMAIDLALRFMRERNTFVEHLAEGGLFQGNAESNELIRVKFDPTSEIYPTLSGNRYRYSIRFMKYNPGNAQISTQDTVKFELANC